MQRTISATPTSLEVGVRNGSEGWLRIRAEVGGEGEVKASLTAASEGGQVMLARQLPALNAYLHSEQMAVTTTVADRSFAAATSSHGESAQGRESGYRADGYSGAGGSGSLSQGGGAQGDSRPEQGSAVTSVAGGSESGWTPAGEWVSPLTTAQIAQAAAQAPSLSGEVFENGQWLNVRA